MPDLTFRVLDVAPIAYSATASLAFSLQVENSRADEEIASVALQCQLRIVPPARRYSPGEQAGLHELFGEPARWGRTMPPSLLWTHVQLGIPAFTGTTVVTMPVPCTFDFNVAGTKYFHALTSGEVPLELLFSGTVFYRTEDDALQIWQVPWAKQASFGLPVHTWQRMMDLHHPNSSVLQLRRDVFDRLSRLKTLRGLSTFDQTLEVLLSQSEGRV